MTIQSIAPAEYKTWAQSHEHVLVDVRDDTEWDLGHMPTAVHFPMTAFQDHARTQFPQQDACIVLYCEHGVRSKLAVGFLQRAGYTNVFHLAGGYEALQPYL
jgi:rhodanese-related sulfurtransferase